MSKPLTVGSKNDLTREECEKVVWLYDKHAISIPLIGKRFSKSNEYINRILNGDVYYNVRSEKRPA